MDAIWSEKAKFQFWFLVEMTVLEARIRLGHIKIENGLALIEQAKRMVQIDAGAINEYESKVSKHDVVAFLHHVSPQIPEELRPYLHQLMTSYDVHDPAFFAFQLRQSVILIREQFVSLMDVLKRRAREFKKTLQMGRTHLVHAEYTTFGLTLAKWYEEAKQYLQTLDDLIEKVAVAKFSGAVGNYTLPPIVEKEACRLLNVRHVVATQIITRSIVAHYVSDLVIVAGFMNKIADDLRKLTATECCEVQEYFKPGQKGSSAMPHKRNPISLENIGGQYRSIIGLPITAFLNQETDFERDLRNSSAERNTIADVSHLTLYIVVRLTNVIDKMYVYPKNMLRNAALSHGLVFSQLVQSTLADKGQIPREDAHQLVYDIAQHCIEENCDFFTELKANDKVMAVLDEVELKAMFNPWAQLPYLDEQFESIFDEVA